MESKWRIEMIDSNATMPTLALAFHRLQGGTSQRCIDPVNNCGVATPEL